MANPFEDALNGIRDREVARREKRCIQPPIGCGKPIDETKFRDDTSRREYRITNLCQDCQDAIFAPSPEVK